MSASSQRDPQCRHRTGDVRCTAPALDAASFCSAHIGMRRQCKATSRQSGVRCKKVAAIGLEQCEIHGARLPQSAAKSARAQVLSAMQRFVTPYEGELSPVGAFEDEFRRTIGRIHWYDEQLALLATADDLVWGRTRQDDVSATEFAGVNTTYEAKANAFLELQWRERKHLLELEKVWLGKDLEQQRVDILRNQVADVRRMVGRAFEVMGYGLEDPKVKAALLAINPSEQSMQVQAEIVSIDRDAHNDL